MREFQGDFSLFSRFSASCRRFSGWKDLFPHGFVWNLAFLVAGFAFFPLDLGILGRILRAEGREGKGKNGIFVLKNWGGKREKEGEGWKTPSQKSADSRFRGQIPGYCRESMLLPKKSRNTSPGSTPGVGNCPQNGEKWGKIGENEGKWGSSGVLGGFPSPGAFPEVFLLQNFPDRFKISSKITLKKGKTKKNFPFLSRFSLFPGKKKMEKYREEGEKPRKEEFRLKKSLEKPENCGFPTRTQKAPILAQNSSLIPFPGRIFLCFFPREFQFGIQTRESPLRSELR